MHHIIASSSRSTCPFFWFTPQLCLRRQSRIRICPRCWPKILYAINDFLAICSFAFMCHIMTLNLFALPFLLLGPSWTIFFFAPLFQEIGLGLWQWHLCSWFYWELYEILSSSALNAINTLSQFGLHMLFPCVTHDLYLLSWIVSTVFISDCFLLDSNAQALFFAFS